MQHDACHRERREFRTGSRADWKAVQELGEYMLMSQGVRETLDDTSIEEIARANARSTIRGLLDKMNPSLKIELEFPSSNNHSIDRSCTLRPPLQWKYVAEEDRWEKK